MPDRQRKDLRNCFIILAVVGVILGLLAGCAQVAEPVEIPVHVYEDPAMRAQLFSTPCTGDAVKRHIRSAYLDRFKTAQAEFLMLSGEWRSYAGCWAEFTGSEVPSGRDSIGMVFEDGDSYLIDKAKFLAGKGRGT